MLCFSMLIVTLLDCTLFPHELDDEVELHCWKINDCDVRIMTTVCT